MRKNLLEYTYTNASIFHSLCRCRTALHHMTRNKISPIATPTPTTWPCIAPVCVHNVYTQSDCTITRMA